MLVYIDPRIPLTDLAELAAKNGCALVYKPDLIKTGRHHIGGIQIAPHSTPQGRRIADNHIKIRGLASA